MFALRGAERSGGAGAADISRPESRHCWKEKQTHHLPHAAERKRRTRLNAAAAASAQHQLLSLILISIFNHLGGTEFIKVTCFWFHLQLQQLHEEPRCPATNC